MSQSLQMSLHIHPRMKDANDQDIRRRRAIKRNVAGDCDRPVTLPNMARITTNLWIIHQPVECVVQPHPCNDIKAIYSISASASREIV